jgi:hypothetical protein
LRHALVDTESHKWAILDDKQDEAKYPSRFSKVTIFITVKIPWSNILHYDMRGDEFYPQPHLYCDFADDGTPYEGRGYFIARDSYEWELPPEKRIGLDELLKTARRDV